MQGGRNTDSTEGQQGPITHIWIQHKKAVFIYNRKTSKITCLVRDRELLSKDHLFTFKAPTKHLRGTSVAEAERENKPTVTETTQLFGEMSSWQDAAGARCLSPYSEPRVGLQPLQKQGHGSRATDQVPAHKAGIPLLLPQQS